MSSFEYGGYGTPLIKPDKFRITTTDGNQHVYEPAECTTVIDLTIALQDYDQIILSGRRYQAGSILRIEEM